MNNKISYLLRTAAMLAAFSIFAVLTFEAFHASHEEDCHEENCPICFVLQIIHNTNKILHTAPQTSVEFSTFNYINLFILSALFFAPATLVKQKVKLVI